MQKKENDPRRLCHSEAREESRQWTKIEHYNPKSKWREWNGILGYMNRSESLRLEAREQLGLDAMVEAKRKIKSRRSLVV